MVLKVLLILSRLEMFFEWLLIYFMEQRPLRALDILVRLAVPLGSKAQARISHDHSFGIAEPPFQVCQ